MLEQKCDSCRSRTATASVVAHTQVRRRDTLGGVAAVEDMEDGRGTHARRDSRILRASADLRKTWQMNEVRAEIHGSCVCRGPARKLRGVLIDEELYGAQGD